MGYFVRRYQKGIKNSGCKDILRSEDPISVSELVDFANYNYKVYISKRGIRLLPNAPIC